MASLLSLAALTGTALAAVPNVARQDTTDSVNATTVSNITLTPIQLPVPAPEVDVLAPQNAFTVSYGVNDTNYVNVTFTTESGAVLLESVDTLSAVDCDAESVSLTFATAADLEAAYATWSVYDQLVFVTNHLGDCDPEFARGFFLAGEFASYAANLTLVATAERTNVSDVACKNPLSQFLYSNQSAS